MKRLFTALCAAVCLLPAGAATMPLDTIPERAIVLTGDKMEPVHIGNIAELYSRENLAFQDPSAPRFLFLDKKGTVALGIGGYLKATAEYDFDGAVDNEGFVTSLIPVPMNPAQRNRFGATAQNSTLFLKLVTKPTKMGRVTVYFQTSFSGPSWSLVLKQAYLRVGHVTLGKTRSTFADGPAMAPTVDNEGPSGQVTSKNMMVQYISPSYKGFSFAASVEVPKASYTLTPSTEAIAQRCPDIPAYIQYAWDKGNSHVRLSGIMRQLSYRDELHEKNHMKTGWGVQFSTVASITPAVGIFGHYTMGRGIASFVNDLGGDGYDLIPEAGQPGKLRAPRVGAYTAGVQYNFSPKVFATASYSRARLYGASNLGGDTYSYGQYIVANVFYNIWGDLQLGAEYIHGTRKDYSGLSGKANRINAMLQYSF